MILTGKAKNYFIGWLCKSQRSVSINYGHGGNCFVSEINGLPANEIVLNHYYIEWMDSIGVFINISPSIPVGYENPDCFTYSIGINTNILKFDTRQQATEAAIKEANDIYNSRK